jgi:CRP-like cAMP-binding protein
MTIDPEAYNYIVNEEHFPDKAVIIKEGGHSSWIYMILEGKVKVKKKTPKGMLNLMTLKKGDTVGEMILLHKAKEGRPVSFVADGPVTLGLLDSMRLSQDLNTLSPELRKFIATLASRLMDATERVVSIATK